LFQVLLAAAGALQLSRSVLSDPSGGTEGQDTPSRSHWDKKCVGAAKYTTLPLDIADGQCATLLMEIALAEAQELTIVRVSQDPLRFGFANAAAFTAFAS